MEEVTLGPLSFHPLRPEQVVEHVFAALSCGQGGRILTANVELLQQAATRLEVARLYQAASLRVVDGMPLLWLARLGDRPLPARVAGSDLVWSLASRAAQTGTRVFLLGGEPGVAERASERLLAHAPGLQVAGARSPRISTPPTAEQIDAVASELEAAGPALVYCAFGSPKEQELAAALAQRLPATWWLGCGISLSFVAGEVQRAPRWLQRLGLEWLHRMIQEPRRLASRYLGRNLPFFLALVVRQLFRRDVVS